MSIEQWKAGNLYLPGALVSPVTVLPIVRAEIPNAGFEDGDSDWTKSTNVTINEDGATAFEGTWVAKFAGSGSVTSGSVLTDTLIPVTPGNAINLRAVCDLGAGSDSEAYLQLNFYSDLIYTLVSSKTGDHLTVGSDGEWNNITVSTVVPAGAIYVEVAATALSTTGTVRFDNFSWDYVESGASTGLVFKAIQAASGLSGASEPTWPTSAGGTVVDNEVTWEAVAGTTVTWQANSILTSGSTEPVWPTTPGAVIADNNISWECIRLHIDDPNCPQTREVAIGASKIFAGDDDITRFSATLNPRDWTTVEDAGFLPTGMHQGAQIGVSAMGVYRGNLAVWSPSSFQVWQIDPDPAAMALLDAMEGIGSRHHKAVQPVSNDLFFLAALGVRTVGVAAGSTNLATGDAGIPVDILIQADVNDTVDPIATFYPSMGQYWLAFPPYTSSLPGEVDPDDPNVPEFEPTPLGNCNEIWEIGTLTPSLHVSGVVAGTWIGGIIEGVGDLLDARIDNVYAPNDDGEYKLYAGGSVVPIYYPDCQWYYYSGPQINNRMRETYNLTDSGWTKAGGLTVALDQPGLDPAIANNSSTATDASASLKGEYRRRSTASSIGGTDTIVSIGYFRKDLAATGYSLLFLQHCVGTAGFTAAQFHLGTGDIILSPSSTDVNAAVEIRDAGNWWEVYCQSTANGIDGGNNINNAAWFSVYPAVESDASLGNIIHGNAVILYPATIGLVRGCVTEPKSTPSSVIDITQLYMDLANHYDTQGGYYIEWRPMFSHSEISRDVEILSLNGSTGLLYYDYDTQLLTSTDGTNVATVPITVTATQKYRCGVVFGGGQMNIGVDGVWGDAVLYNGSFPAGTEFTILRNPEAVNYWRELRGFRETYSVTEAEITLLMNGGGGGYTPGLPPTIVFPYWDNMDGNGWINLSLTTETTFLATFGTTIEDDDFEAVFAIGGSLTPVASLVNTLDGGNRLQFIDDGSMAEGIMILVDAAGIVLDSVIYTPGSDSDYITVPTGGNYYIVTASDTGNAKIKKWDTTNATSVVDLSGSTPFASVFGVEFGSGVIYDKMLIIPAGGIFIPIKIPVTSDVVKVTFTTVTITSVDTTRTGALNKTVGDFNTAPTAIWGEGGSSIKVGINNPGYGSFQAVPGETYIFNAKNTNPKAANWIRLQIVYQVQ